MNFVLNEYHRDIPDEELLKDIRRVATKTGKDTLTRDEYKNNGGKYGINTFLRHFGGWTEALKLCGLVPRGNQINNRTIKPYHGPLTTEELIKDLRQVALQLNKTSISSGEYSQYGKFSKDSYFHRFTTWNAALVTAGLVPFEVPSGKRIDDYSLLTEIERLWIECGRQPTTTDIKNGLSKYSLHTYERRFGSWRKTLEFFVAYMNGEQEVEKPEEPEEIQLPQITQEKDGTDETGHSTKRDIGLRLRFKVMKRDNFKCCMCGRSPATTLGLELHIDHIIPWSKGGETTFDNLQTLCSDCNLGKGDLSENEQVSTKHNPEQVKNETLCITRFLSDLGQKKQN